MRTRADRLRPGQRIRLGNAIPATILESGPYREAKGQWLLTLQPIGAARNIGQFQYALPSDFEVDVDSDLLAIR